MDWLIVARLLQVAIMASAIHMYAYEWHNTGQRGLKWGVDSWQRSGQVRQLNVHFTVWQTSADLTAVGRLMRLCVLSYEVEEILIESKIVINFIAELQATAVYVNINVWDAVQRELWCEFLSELGS